MLKKFLQVLTGDTALFEETLAQFTEMLRLDKKMFKNVTDALFSGTDMEVIRKDFYKIDGKINYIEQSIRRKLVTHLSMGAKGNVAGSLIMMSVAKDAERIGDYCKNILEVFSRTHRLDLKNPYVQKLDEVRKTILELFNVTSKLYLAEDKAEAVKILKEIDEPKRLCDSVVDDMLLGKGQKDAVACALLARFFKRCLAHMGNILTSIVMPVDKLDYFDDELLE